MLSAFLSPLKRAETQMPSSVFETNVRSHILWLTDNKRFIVRNWDVQMLPDRR